MNKNLNNYFLPDLCNARSIIILLAVSEGLVLAMTLIESSLIQFSWQRFTIVSFFVQWVCLLSVAVICPLRKVFVRMRAWLASGLAILAVVVVTFVVSVIGEILWSSYDTNGIDWIWVIENSLISSIFATMAMRYFYVQSQWQLKRQAELSARLSALQANIRPHFFFNTLNTVASLITIDPDQAERMLLDLAQLFRAVLKNEGSLTSLQEEIELAQHYLRIEQVRLGERMQVNWSLPEVLPNIQVPQLLLQPLLENAVYHGIQPNIEKGFIAIELQPQKNGWELIVRNSVGLARSGQGNHIGQKNTQARLQAYSSEAQLTVNTIANVYTVSLFIPEVQSA